MIRRRSRNRVEDIDAVLAQVVRQANHRLRWRRLVEILLEAVGSVAMIMITPVTDDDFADRVAEVTRPGVNQRSREE